MEVWLIKTIFFGDYYHFICVINCKFGTPKLTDMRRDLRPMPQNQKRKHASEYDHKYILYSCLLSNYQKTFNL